MTEFSARILRSGTDVTIVAISDMVIEALRAAKLLKSIGISAEVIDLVSVYPIDYDTIRKSRYKTGNLFVVDASTPAYSVASEIVGKFDFCIPITYNPLISCMIRLVLMPYKCFF